MVLCQDLVQVNDLTPLMKNNQKINRKNLRLILRIYAYNIINKVGKDAIIMRETRILEFKETIWNYFYKTVSAFSNYDGGTIFFGVDDDGNVKGLRM